MGLSEAATFSYPPLYPVWCFRFTVTAQWIFVQVGRKHQKPLTCQETHTIEVLCVCVCVCVQSCLTLYDSMDCSLPDSSVHGISQQEDWSGLPFPSPGFFPAWGLTHVPYTGRRILYHCTTWEAHRGFSRRILELGKILVGKCSVTVRLGTG